MLRLNVKQPKNKSINKTNNVLDNKKPSRHIPTKDSPLGKKDKNTIKKFSKLKRPVNMILGDSITHAINIAELERATGKFLYLPGKGGTTGAKAYRCYTSLRGGRFPNNSYSQKLPELLQEVKIDNLFMQTPTNDITNLSEHVHNDTTIKSNKKDMVHTVIYNSSKSMVNFASFALENYPIDLVVLIDRPMRIDKMSKISELSNKYLKEIIEKMNNEKITIAHHSIHKRGERRVEIFGDHKISNYDGIHLRGKKGKQAIQKSFTDIIKQSLK